VDSGDEGSENREGEHAPPRNEAKGGDGVDPVAKRAPARRSIHSAGGCGLMGCGLRALKRSGRRLIT